MTAPAVAVIGIGNVLCSDDGVGVAAIHRLVRRYSIPENVSLIDGGTLGLALLPYVAEAEYLLILDGMRATAPPGTLIRLEGDAVLNALRERPSAHEVGVSDLLISAKWIDRYPREVVLLGSVTESTALGLQRSDAVEQSVALLVAATVAELERIGVAGLIEKQAHGTPPELERIYGALELGRWRH